MLRELATGIAGITTFYWWVHLLATAGRALKRRWLLTPDTYPPAGEGAPTVSVLIPARNEAAAIGDCLRCALGQDHPLHEILVLNDDSTDGTGDIIEEVAAEHTIVKQLHGEPLPEGWMGKSHALHQAAARATGDWLLFIDADVKLSPQALRQALGMATEDGCDMLSWFAQFDLKSFWERSMMPFIADFIVLFSPLDKVNDPSSDHCIANGQFILIRRDVYEKIGGHAAIRASVIDDVSLARAVKFGGWRYRMAFALGLMKTRMYSSLGQIWNGFAKNFYAATKHNPNLGLAAIAYLLLTAIAPALLLPWAVANMASGTVEAFEVLALATAVGMVAYRTLTHRIDPGFPWLHTLLHPLQGALFIGIIIDSMARHRGWRRTTWKDRPVAEEPHA